MIYDVARSLTRAQKRYIFLVLDIFIVPVSMLASFGIDVSVKVSWGLLEALLPMFILMMVFGGLLSSHLGLTRIRLNGYENRAIFTTMLYASILGATAVILNVFMGKILPIETFTIFTMILLIFTVASRMLLRQVVLYVYGRSQKWMRVLVYGAGQTGQQLVAALRTDDTVVPVAFVDDNPAIQSLSVAGLQVFAPSQIKQLIVDKEIDRVVLAMPSIGQPQISRIAHRLREINVEVHALPSFAELVSEGNLGRRATPVSLIDLLGRNHLAAELPSVSEAYSGHRILITGAGGSIGSELCRQLVGAKPDCIVLLDHSELSLYNIEKELQEIAPDLCTVSVLGSVCDKTLVQKVFAEHDVNVVLHAAAYKHLPLVQKNPIDGLRNNVLGTKVMADAAREAGVERFILVSSDKAVRPTNVMGASKRLAELVVQDLATRSEKTRFSMVRFGNVLGSSGSVIPLFEEQIAKGGPVTLTHGAVTRYFMTISEAARLVLLAGSFARGGDVFVLDMGDPVPIRKLAYQMIEAAGCTIRDENNPDGDIEVKITGLRPGEKLHEELLISADMLTTPHQKILRAQEFFLSELEMANALRDLRNAIDARDAEAAKTVVERWVECGETVQNAEEREEA